MLGRSYKKNYNFVIPMKRFILYLTLVVAALLLHIERSSAQEYEELDYKDFKFYKEDDTDLSLWGGLNDSLIVESESRHYAPNSRYALSYATNTYRGERISKSSNLFGYAEVDYTTLRTLKGLGYAINEYNGIGHAHLSATTGRTSTILTDSRPYDGSYMRAEFSGKDYLVGISHRGAYSIDKYGVPLKEGWMIMDYARVRTGRDIYVEGVFTNSVDLAVGATYSRRNDRLDVILSLPWSQRGLRQASTEEAYSLTHNTLYNPAWGIQNSKVRNSRVATSLRPEIIALWQRKLSVVTDFTLSANGYFERLGTSSLTWFNAPTPAPDNYKYMPSYYSDNEQTEVSNAWTTNNLHYTQIDWDRLYHTNSLQQDGSARYAVTLRRTNLSHIALNAGFSSRVGIVNIEYGAELQGDSERRFRVMDDLMGATHIRDIDYYLEDDATYSHLTDNNLRNPDNIVGEGERYGYDYRLGRIGLKLYSSVAWSINNFDFWVGAQMTPEHIWRRGYFEKELFAGNASYGRSTGITLTPAMLSASCRYSIDSHIISAAIKLSANSPNSDALFLQPEYNNRMVAKPELATTISSEVGYSYTAKRLRLDAAIYLNSTTRESDVVRYYDDLAGEYSDAVVSGIGRIHYGIEATAEASWSRLFSSTFAINLAQYRYHRNPTIAIYSDDDNTLIANTISHMRRHHVGAPEISLYGDICFRHNGWMARASAQYWALGYITPSVIRRTERILSYAASTEERETLKFQQQLPGTATIDLALSKYFRLTSETSLGVQLSARNILGSNVVYSGYEENRISLRKVGSRTDVAPFANRLSYAYPRLISLSVSLHF